MTSKQLAISSLLALLLAACGGDDFAGGDDRPGFTECGNYPDQMGKTCNPGQYCADEIFSDCSLGCLGDYNCESGSTCLKEPGDDVGSCDASSPPADEADAGAPMGDALGACLNACSILTACGAIDVADGAQCTSDCNGLLSDGQRQAVADCVGAWDCSGDIPACLRLECGPAYDCPLSGEQCLGGTCL